MNYQQLAIFICSSVGLWLTGSKEPLQRYRGFIIALIGQPLILIANYEASQWGMFAMNIIVTVAFFRGIFENKRTVDANR